MAYEIQCKYSMVAKNKTMLLISKGEQPDSSRDAMIRIRVETQRQSSIWSCGAPLVDDTGEESQAEGGVVSLHSGNPCRPCCTFQQGTAIPRQYIEDSQFLRAFLSR